MVHSLSDHRETQFKLWLLDELEIEPNRHSVVRQAPELAVRRGRKTWPGLREGYKSCFGLSFLLKPSPIIYLIPSFSSKSRDCFAARDPCVPHTCAGYCLEPAWSSLLQPIPASDTRCQWRTCSCFPLPRCCEHGSVLEWNLSWITKLMSHPYFCCQKDGELSPASKSCGGLLEGWYHLWRIKSCWCS